MNGSRARSSRAGLTALVVGGLVALAACGNGSGAVLASEVERAAPDASAPADAWVAGVNEAGWRFHRSLPGDAVSSPASIGTAFSFVRAGASPESGAALDTIFGFPAEGRDAAANAVIAALEASSVETTTLTVANRLFPDEQFVIEQPFVDTGAAHYGAGLQPIGTTLPDDAAAAINDWVDEQTRGLIRDIVTPETVQGSAIVVVNTVYMKADWWEPFDANDSYNAEFYSPVGTVTTPFMSFDFGSRNVVELDGADAVELPYRGDDLAMWLVVPRDFDGLEAVEAGLTAADLVGFGERARWTDIALALPKWEQALPPTDLLDRWLCPSGFCPGAPLPGVGPQIAVDEALHAARIIVDEKGTEAGAATAVSGDTMAGPEPEMWIDADRPFLWFIEHQPTGTIVFLGRVTNPTPPQE